MDIKKTQHFTENENIIKNLIHYIPIDSEKIEPFNGNGDISKFFTNVEKYDIDPKTTDTIKKIHCSIRQAIAVNMLLLILLIWQKTNQRIKLYMSYMDTMTFIKYF